MRRLHHVLICYLVVAAQSTPGATPAGTRTTADEALPSDFTEERIALEALYHKHLSVL